MNDEREGLPSASGAHRFVNCAASHRLQSLAPPEESTDPLAAEGTIIHEALETEDGTELTLNQSEIVKKLEEIDRLGYQQWREDFPIKDKGTAIREERFFIYGPNGEKTGSSKPDRVYIIGDHALADDFKSGYKQVEDASRSWQGRAQAISIWQNNPELTHVRISFSQFRLRKFYTSCDYGLSDLEYALQEWNLAGWRSKQPDATTNPGWWCTGCRARGFCKAHASMSLLPSAMVQNGKIVDKADAILAAMSLSVEDLKAIYDRRTIIEDVLEAVKRRMKALPDETLKELGYRKMAGAKFISKVDINALFQLLWDDGLWNDIPEEKRLNHASTEFGKVTTALSGKLKDLVLPKWIAKGRFQTTKAAEAHLTSILEKVSVYDQKEITLRKVKE